MSLEQDDACHDLQARTISRNELAPPVWLQPVAYDRHGCKVHRRVEIVRLQD
jgi:hypothetical protein